VNKFLSVLTVVILLSLSGCINYVQDMIIYPDGSGKLKINYWMDYREGESVPVLEAIGLFNPDSIKKEFSSAFTTVTYVEAKTDTSDSTLHAIVHLDFTHVDSLSKLKVFSQYEFSLKDGASGQKIYTQFIPPITTGFGIDGSKYSITYNIDFRGDIVTHNATQKYGQILSWSYSLPEIGRGKTISVTFKPFKLKETPYWIYILTGIVLLVVVIFLFKKKKD
jgi:hypothetical protein